MSDVSIIGAGFSGLAAACYAAQKGHKVTIHEKNATIGGRARQFSEQGFTYDMGPSWYWMPDVFERFFNDFGKSASDYYDLVKLDPGFKVFFKDQEPLNVSASLDELYAIFEKIESGSASKLKQFLREAEYKYSVGMKDLVHKPALSWFEFMNYNVFTGMMKSHMFKSVSSYVRSYFKDERLRMLLEFPVLFLGAMPQNIPALYTLMNHAALTQGTYYPMGGMYKIVEAMSELARTLGVDIQTSSPVEEITTIDKTVKGVYTSKGFNASDVVIASGDYAHIEQALLKKNERNYREQYWSKKTFAPSCLIYYVGVKKKVQNLEHHNLFFDTDFMQHSRDIYKNPKWPDAPLFYVCCPSKTDSSVAPECMENLFILIPVATGIEDTEEIREKYFPEVLKRIEQHTVDTVSEHVVYKKSYSINDFVQDYNAYGGNAYGLANTLMQTAVLKPSVKNNVLNNLFYTGQLTVPGPGVPPSLISGKISAELAMNYLKKSNYEKAAV